MSAITSSSVLDLNRQDDNHWHFITSFHTLVQMYRQNRNILYLFKQSISPSKWTDTSSHISVWTTHTDCHLRACVKVGISLAPKSSLFSSHDTSSALHCHIHQNCDYFNLIPQASSKFYSSIVSDLPSSTT